MYVPGLNRRCSRLTRNAKLHEFDRLCRQAMRGLHYGQELVSTKGSDTFAQTTRSDKLRGEPPASIPWIP